MVDTRIIYYIRSSVNQFTFTYSLVDLLTFYIYEYVRCFLINSSQCSKVIKSRKYFMFLALGNNSMCLLVHYIITLS